MFRVVVTEPAKDDLQAAHDWWAENRSAEQAARWYVGIHKAIKTLMRMPERCSLVTDYAKTLELHVPTGLLPRSGI
ncbi:type II toxin-antitoxin system RelE/ParE family toxin [Adhaeretor mobilis]|uniref:Type II toxin-antitoxin system RelE/ParE family toxin n=1 Tax=Adhaeretor mobilis TaxID=1930276 RepID=A0A517N0P9_9BACT|nr:type II toxin-antitoxin system RelE/ParE family toxin [Adhaeretor mobilis]QDT00711.1 hypothetical protein HG15A2_40510 [Adhaeretor mobilis]